MGLADYIKSQLPYWPNWITYPLMKINIFGGLCYGRAYMSFEKELKKLEHHRIEMAEVTDTLESLKPLIEFTDSSLKCAQFIEAISKLIEDAPILAYSHLGNKEFDKFKEDKKQLLETNKLYERYRYLFNIYDKLLDEIQEK